MSLAQAAAVTARLDRLPSSPYLWRLLVLLSLGGFFEIYDLFLTAYVTPGLIRDKIFLESNQGLFGLTDQATFAAAMFAGLFVGTILFGWVADRYGRRTIFTFALLWYAAATAIMAFQRTRLGVNLWRFVTGVGVGVELITIDAYVSELMPKALRGRAFAINQAIQFLAAPVGTFLAWQLVPLHPFGISGWRIVVLVPVIGALLVWWIRREVPESPRWLAQHGKVDEAEKVMAGIETRIAAETGKPLPGPGRPVEEVGNASFSEIWKPPYAQRAIMLAIFNFFQTIGFYGFANWVPQLLASQGASFTKSLQYGFIIALIYPFGALHLQTVRRQDRAEMADRQCRARHGDIRPDLRAHVRAPTDGDPRELDHDDQQLAVQCLSGLSGRAVPHPHPSPSGRLRLFVQPRLDRVHELHDRLLPAKFRHDRRVRLHRLRHGGRHDLDRRLRAAHQ
ncbi:MAG: MFS transporter [Chthoniobacterales bacterium]